MSALPFEKLDRSTPPTAVEVARSILDYVLRSGEVGVGDKLPPERQFADAFGVGRSAIREALKSLSLLGLVEIRQGDGSYVASHSSDLLPRVIEWGLLLGERRTLETIEARQHIETTIAGLAAARRDDASLDRLRSRLEEMEAAVDDPAALVAADVEFHLELAHAAGNRVLSNILASLQSLLHVWIGRVIAEDPGNALLTINEHRRIFDAIASGDSARSEQAMTAHLADARRRLEVTVQNEDEAPATNES